MVIIWIFLRHLIIRTQGDVIMFQCKDLLTLPSMAKARIIAGKSGLSNRIRWVYKPENMNFAKWVKGQELLIISTPVIQSKDFDLQAVIKKAKKLDMAGALLLVGDKYIASIGSTIISYSNLNDFPIFVISGEIPLVDIFEEIGHAIAYNKDSDVLSDDILSGIIFGKEYCNETECFIQSLIYFAPFRRWTPRREAAPIPPK